MDILIKNNIRNLLIFLLIASCNSNKNENKLYKSEQIPKLCISTYSEYEILNFVNEFLRHIKVEKKFKYCSISEEAERSLNLVLKNMTNMDYILKIEKAILKKDYMVEYSKDKNEEIVILSFGKKNEILGTKLGSFFIKNDNQCLNIYKINFPK